MYRLSLIISEVYQEYQDLAKQRSIHLNLDLGDGLGEVETKKEVNQELSEQLNKAFQRAKCESITIKLRNKQIIIHDTGTALSKTACRLLSHKNVTVESRVGFGTKVVIDFNKIDKHRHDTKLISTDSESE